MIYMSIVDYHRAWTNRFQNIPLNIKTLHEATFEALYNDHLAFTSGEFTAKDRRSMGYPYAKKVFSTTAARGVTKASLNGLSKGASYSTPVTDKNGKWTSKIKTQRNGRSVRRLPINRDSGNLQDSLGYAKFNSNGDDVYWVSFGVNYAKWVLNPAGLPNMVPRGFYSTTPNSNSPGAWGILAKRHKARMSAAAIVVRNQGLSGAVNFRRIIT